MEILGYFLAVLIGISLGMLGSGGSILTVPVLVYLLKMHPSLATTSSLFIVGITSLIGGIKAYSRKLVHFQAVTEFGIPSIVSIFITRHYILPALPEQLFSVGHISISKETFLMLLFAILMVAASVAMIKNYDTSGTETTKSTTNKTTQNKAPALMTLGLIIGFITGLLGAGGGFLIIPSLVLFLKMPMKRAVGTSLFIIAINTLFGFLFSLKQFEFEWPVIISFTLLSIMGIFIGSRLADKIPAASLKKIFGWFILIMGAYIISKELFFH